MRFFAVFAKVLPSKSTRGACARCTKSLANETVFGKFIVPSAAPIASRSIGHGMTCGRKIFLKFAPWTVRHAEPDPWRNQLASKTLEWRNYPTVKVA
jgi:hypothetical protein